MPAQVTALQSMADHPNAPVAFTGIRALQEAGSISNFRAMADTQRSFTEQLRIAAGIPTTQHSTPLPTQEHEMLDEMTIEVAQENLQLVTYLRSQPGILKSVPGWLGAPEVKRRRISRGGGAHVGMLPDARSETFRLDYSFVVLPLFATWDMFEFHIREAAEAERLGAPLDFSHGQQAAKNVNLSVEDKGVNGFTPTIGGNSVYGILTAPNANTVAYSGSNPAWDHASKSGLEITNDVKSMLVALKGDNNMGGAGTKLALFVEVNYEIEIRQKRWSDGTTTLDKSVAEYIEGMHASGIDIVGLDQLSDDRTALVRMSPDVVRLYEGQSVTPMSWSDPSGMHSHHMQLACQVVDFLDDYDGQSGVVTGNTS